MDYQRIYNSLVDRARMRPLEGYVEKHHVIPRCMGGPDDLDNIVALTAEEHYLCHQLLVKIHPGHIGLAHAALLMARKKKIGNKRYGWLRRNWSSHMKGPNNPQKLNPRSGDRHHYAGVTRLPHQTEISKKRASERMTMANPCRGVKPWNNTNASDYTRSVWCNAEMLFDLWNSNSNPSYCGLYTLYIGKPLSGENGKIAPYMSICKYFRQGWVPALDPEWIEFKGSNK